MQKRNSIIFFSPYFLLLLSLSQSTASFSAGLPSSYTDCLYNGMNSILCYDPTIQKLVNWESNRTDLNSVDLFDIGVVFERFRFPSFYQDGEISFFIETNDTDLVFFNGDVSLGVIKRSDAQVYLRKDWLQDIYWFSHQKFIALSKNGEGFYQWEKIDGNITTFSSDMDECLVHEDSYRVLSVIDDVYYFAAENEDRICWVDVFNSKNLIDTIHIYGDESRVLFLNSTTWGTISSGSVNSYGLPYALNNQSKFFSSYDKDHQLWIIGEYDSCNILIINQSSLEVTSINTICLPVSAVVSPNTELLVVTNNSFIIYSLAEGNVTGQITFDESIVECLEMTFLSPSMILVYYRNSLDLLSLMTFEISNPEDIYMEDGGIYSERNTQIPDEYRLYYTKEDGILRFISIFEGLSFYSEAQVITPSNITPSTTAGDSTSGDSASSTEGSSSTSSTTGSSTTEGSSSTSSTMGSSTTEEPSSSTSSTMGSSTTEEPSSSTSSTMGSSTTEEPSSSTSSTMVSSASKSDTMGSSTTKAETEDVSSTEDTGNCATSDCRSCKDGYYGLKCDQTESGIFPLINCVSKIGNIYKVHFGYINSNPGSPIGDDFASLLVIDDTTSEDITIDITKKNNHFAFSRECELSIDWTLGERDVSFTSDSFDSSIMCRAEAKVILRLRNRNGPVSEGTLTNISHAIANYLGISPESVSVKNIDSKKRQTSFFLLNNS
eukprot:TRINITY_DN6151_c0_g1_i4.p1 TRINITY_DN6151_c0_g1~~TRINITY_DN6151_c0_g1_i4.p1  ORF type:complete len:719 (+),score=132.78 TRINITY_DN6151_c0_g1_i4:7-2163(+)